MNGNISKDGIAKDLDWMSRMGIGGASVIDAGLSTPQVVQNRLAYMTPEWKDALRFAVTDADRLGLELGIASAPGWSETGGPWVPAEDGLKKLVWSETRIAGGRPFDGKLVSPPGVTGPFQSMKTHESVGAGAMPSLYQDIAVLAFSMADTDLPLPAIADGNGAVIDRASLIDDDLDSGVAVSRGTAEAPGSVRLDYTTPQTVRSATLFIPGAVTPFGAAVAPRLEASDDGVVWREVGEFIVTDVPTTIGFQAVTAQHFRIVLAPKSVGSPAPTAKGIVMADGPPASGKIWRINELTLSGEDRVDSFEVKAGFAVSQDYYHLGNLVAGGAAVDPAQIIDLTSRLKADGSLDWTPPAGTWRVVRIGYSLLGTTNHPAPKEATGLEVDKFDGAAVHRYLDHYLATYRDAVGVDLVGRHGITAFTNDSIEVGAANWTPLLIEHFKELRGYDPTPWLPTLTGIIVGSRSESDRFLYDFRRTLADLMASQHYGTIAEVARQSGLRSYAEALEDSRPSLGDDMAMRSFTDVPMSALWTFRQEDGPRPTYLADMKGAASVAHLYGRTFVAAESMTTRKQPWAFAPRDLRHVMDLEFVSGINLPVVHSSVHQPVDDKVPGVSLAWFGQNFNRHETWAEMAKPWVDYMARNAFMLQQGRYVADVAYFYGEEAPLTGLYAQRPVADAPTTSAYDFVNTDALMTVLRNDGHDLVAKSGARYRVLYLGGSSDHMTLPTLRRIAALVEGGATIVGLPPVADPSLGDDPAQYATLVKRLWAGGAETIVGKGRVIAGTDIESAVRSCGVAPDFRFTGAQIDSDIPFLHRKLPDGDSYLLVNRKTRAETFEGHFRVTGRAPELWHADTGRAERVSYRIENGETIVPLSLAAEESVFVVFRKSTAVSSWRAPKAPVQAEVRIDGPWQVKFEPGRGAPASTTLNALAPLNENADPAIKYFSGIATYTNDVVAPAGWRPGQPIWLDLGEVDDLAEVSVNGKNLGEVWHAPYRLDIAGAMHSGRNRIEIRVADLWVNRLIGDAQPGAVKITYTSMPTYRADAPLRRSGLIGPVIFLTEKK